MNETDVAYLAGLIDGEGSIYIEQRKDSGFFRLTLRIVITHYPTLRHIQSLWGGHLGNGNSGKRKGDSYNRRNIFVLEWDSEKAFDILVWVYPYLKIKKEEAQVAVFYQSGREDERKGRGKKLTDEKIAEYAWFKERLHSLKRYNFPHVEKGNAAKES